MDDIVCAFCGIEMKNNDLAYGVSRGLIKELSCGFIIDENSDWDIYCPECMNEIDRVVANYKLTRNQ